ncbi:MAG: serine/threonine-protein kinase [Polyangiaceae bacterium]
MATDFGPSRSTFGEVPSNPSNTGKTLGKYRLLARLGQGGMAEVYLAVVAGPGGFNKLQVIKVMKPELLEEPEHRTMFLEEGRLAARLNHPNIVQTNEVQIEGDNHFIAMEYLDGQPLHRIVRRSRKGGDGPPLQWHLHILCEVLSALEYAHTVTNYDGSPLAVVHRDVTPHNVFVTYAGQVKLCDFGIAKTMSSSIETRHGVLKGKVSYMAPEQVLSTRVDRRADLFAVGIMLWEAVTGQRMWNDLSDLQIMQALSQGQIPRAADAKPGLDAELLQILDRALSMDAEGRYATAADFKRDLEMYLFSQTARIRPDAIGKWVSGLFEQERANLQKVIQDQLSGSSSSAPPALDHPRAPAQDSSPSRSGLLASSAGPGRSLTIPSVEVSGPPHRAKRSRGTLAALVGALAASVVFLLGIVIVLTLRARASQPTVVSVETASHETTPTNEAPAPAAAPMDKQIQITVNVTPESARMSLDGHSLAGNPWKSEVAADGKAHELVISADGYESETRTLTFDVTQRIEIHLKKSKGKVVFQAPAPAPAPRPEPKPDPEPAPKPGGGKPLDTTDPW